jgi:hypothetical protein
MVGAQVEDKQACSQGGGVYLRQWGAVGADAHACACGLAAARGNQRCRTVLNVSLCRIRHTPRPAGCAEAHIIAAAQQYWRRKWCCAAASDCWGEQAYRPPA